MFIYQYQSQWSDLTFKKMVSYQLLFSIQIKKENTSWLQAAKWYRWLNFQLILRLWHWLSTHNKELMTCFDLGYLGSLLCQIFASWARGVMKLLSTHFAFSSLWSMWKRILLWWVLRLVLPENITSMTGIGYGKGDLSKGLWSCPFLAISWGHSDGDK